MGFAKTRAGALALVVGLTAAAAAPRTENPVRPGAGPADLAALLTSSRTLRVAGRTAEADAVDVRAVTLAEGLGHGKLMPGLVGSRAAPVLAVAFSPDGHLVASGEGDLIRLWAFPSGIALDTLHGHSDAVERLVFSPDGKLLASGGRDEKIRLWDVATGRQLYALEGHSAWIGALAFSADGKLLASGGGDHHLKLWDLGRRSELRPLTGPVAHGDSLTSQHGNAITCAAFSPDGAWLASGSSDRQVKLWNVATGQAVAWLEARAATSMVRALAFTADGKTLASAGNDGAVYLWDTATVTTPPPAPPPVKKSRHKPAAPPAPPLPPPDLEPQRTLPAGSDPVPVLALTWDGDGLLLAADARGAVTVWKPTGELVHHLPGRPVMAQAVTFAPTANLIVSADVDHGLHVASTPTSSLISQWSHDLAAPARAPLAALAFDDAGTTLVSGGQGGVIARWNLTTSQVDVHVGHQLKVDAWQAPPPDVLALAFVDRTLAVARDDDSVVAFDERWNEVSRLETEGWIRALAAPLLSAWGTQHNLATAGDDQVVRRWSLFMGTSKKSSQRLAGHTAGIAALAAGPKALASGGDDGTIRLWNGAKTVLLNTARVRALAWAGETLISGDADGNVRSWDAAAGTHTDWQHGGPVNALAVHGALVVSAGQDGKLELWPGGTAIPAHSGPARALAFAPSGLLASAGDDGTVRLWDAAGHPLATLLANRASWVVIGDDGAVDGSPDAMSLIDWQVGGFVLPGSAVFAARRVPGLLGQIVKRVKP